jgi:hypothetical protein
MKNTTNIQQITEALNNFANHCYYEMRDGWKYTDGQTAEQEIESSLKGLTVDELIQIKADTKLSPEMIDRYFKAYFNDLPEPETEAKASFRSKVMAFAHRLFATGEFTSFGLALSASWKRYKLIQRMRDGIAYFSFVKADNSTRYAIGTLRDGNFSYENKGASKKENPLQVKYFDVERKAFRSLNLTRLIEIAA